VDDNTDRKGRPPRWGNKGRCQGPEGEVERRNVACLNKEYQNVRSGGGGQARRERGPSERKGGGGGWGKRVGKARRESKDFRVGYPRGKASKNSGCFGYGRRERKNFEKMKTNCQKEKSPEGRMKMCGVFR